MVDFLSRNALEGIEQADVMELSKEEIRKVQESDSVCELIKNFLQKDLIPSEHLLTRAINPYLQHFKLDEDKILWKMSYLVEQLVLPRQFVERTISLAHDTIISGYRDAQRMMERIKRVYWWPRMEADVSAYVQACNSCQRKRGFHSRAQGTYPL